VDDLRAKDQIVLTISNLKRMRLRLALTVTGVVIGTSSIVLMMAVGIGLQRNVTEELGAMGAATHINVFAGFMPGMADPKSIDSRSVAEIEAIENVDVVMPQVAPVTVTGIEYKRSTAFFSMQGVEIDAFEQLGFAVEHGRLPRSEGEVVVGAMVPRDAFFVDGEIQRYEPADLLGARLDLTYTDFPVEGIEMDAETIQEPQEHTRRMTVVGVLASADMQTDRSAFITLDAALELNGTATRRPVYDSLIVQADSPVDVADIEAELREMGYEPFSARTMQQGINSMFLIIQGVLGALGAIAMIVAALGITNTMTMSIYERTKEIGIMKAVGASNRQIKRVFLGEASIIGVLGGVIGLAFSVSTAALGNLFVQDYIAMQMAMQPAGAAADGETQMAFFHIPLWLAVFAVVFSASVGLLAGMFPAVRAANLDPLNALRHE